MVYVAAFHTHPPAHTHIHPPTLSRTPTHPPTHPPTPHSVKAPAAFACCPHQFRSQTGKAFAPASAQLQPKCPCFHLTISSSKFQVPLSLRHSRKSASSRQHGTAHVGLWPAPMPCAGQRRRPCTALRRDTASWTKSCRLHLVEANLAAQLAAQALHRAYQPGGQPTALPPPPFASLAALLPVETEQPAVPMPSPLCRRRSPRRGPTRAAVPARRRRPARRPRSGAHRHSPRRSRVLS
jgi:hypothetical protein